MNSRISKKIFTSILVLGIITSSTGLNKAEAAEQEEVSYSLKQATNLYSEKLNENSDSDDLIETLKSVEESKQVNNLSKNDKLNLLENILNSVPENVVRQYQKEKMNELNKVLSDEKNMNSSEFKTIKLSDGSSVELISTDELDNGNSINLESSPVNSRSLVMGPYRAENKKYGDRLYTAWVELKSLGITVTTLKLGNHYSVGNYGLKMRYADVGGTNGTALSSVDASCEVIDSKAEKVGYDMNAVGTYKISGKINSGYIVLTSYIELTSLNKASKVAHVYQRYTYRD